MPSSSRRSGTAHTSKGRSQQQSGVGQVGESSCSHLQEEEQTQQSDDDIAIQVEEMLFRLENNPEPLSLDASDNKLKSLQSDWASMEANFTIAYEVITQVGERLAEEIAAEGIIEDDDNLQELDVGIRGMIDLAENVRHRRFALEELRTEVNSGEKVTDAADRYKSRTKQLDNEYEARTLRQRYVQSRPYKAYRTAVWEALREDDMPPLADLLAPEANDMDDDEDIVAYGGDRQKFKCPLSLQIMIEPLKSTICQHSFEKKNILEFLGNLTKPCPTGCSKNLNKKTLIEDVNLTRACRKFARREQSRKEIQKTQAQATLID